MLTRRIGRLRILLLGVAITLMLGSTASGSEPVTERVTVSSLGIQSAGASQSASVSGDGRYVAFSSDSPNLVDGDTNSRDVFVRDRELGTTELVSVSSDGVQADRPAFFPAISDNGRFIVYESESANLVPGDVNDAPDIFCYDRVNGTTELVSLTNDGSQGNAGSFTPSTSADGRYVTFTSLADNLVVGDTNDDRDVFVRDLQTGTTERISVSTEGVEGDAASGGLGAGPGRIPGDGRFVVFGSFADNLAPNDTNERDDVFLRDRMLGTTILISVDDDGSVGNNHSFYGDVSDDGRFAVFHSPSDNLVSEDTNDESDVFLRDIVNQTTTRLSLGLGHTEANAGSEFARISADGSLVAYQSLASNLVASDTNLMRDIFVQDLNAGTVTRISLGSGDLQSNGHSSSVAMSTDGLVFAYQSIASNLVPVDTNETFDIFAWGKSDFVPATPTFTPFPTPTATLTVPTSTPPISPTATPSDQLGDVNCSGSVNAIDAALILQFVAGLLGSLSCPDAANVNGSGDINAIDAALVLQFVAGLFQSLLEPQSGSFAVSAETAGSTVA